MSPNGPKLSYGFLHQEFQKGDFSGTRVAVLNMILFTFQTTFLIGKRGITESVHVFVLSFLHFIEIITVLNVFLIRLPFSTTHTHTHTHALRP